MLHGQTKKLHVQHKELRTMEVNAKPTLHMYETMKVNAGGLFFPCDGVEEILEGYD